MTPNPDFNDAPLYDVEYLRNSTRLLSSKTHQAAPFYDQKPETFFGEGAQLPLRVRVPPPVGNGYHLPTVRSFNIIKTLENLKKTSIKSPGNFLVLE